MPVYRLGSHGAEVTRLQEALRDRGFYRGPLDGELGGGTHAAVVAFQRRNKLVPDGRVGAKTWAAIFDDQTEIPAPAIGNEDLKRRCLALTGAFETGTGLPECFCGLSGDFDGQGLSFGVLQWNFGQGTLQPLLKDMIAQHRDVAEAIFGDHYDALREALDASEDELMSFARSVQHPVKHTVFEPWRGYAKALGRTPEFQAIQAKHASGVFTRAVQMTRDYGVWSERAVALMFDIVTQNGSIRAVTRAQILADAKALPGSLTAEEREVRTLEMVANRRAEAANPRWVDDVRRRKLCIARGEGVVHGIRYDLEEQFGIRLVRHAA
jgi:Putative peptidoglycan binding domain